MKQLSLNGVWEMRCTQSQEWIRAEVPGSVYQDLLREKKIEDPFYRDNEGISKAVSEKDYEYRKVFQVEEAFYAMDKILLSIEGIDTIAAVFINQIPVLQCDNMHLIWEQDVKQQLKPGRNEITISFTSPYKQIEIIKKKHPDMDLERHLFQAKMQMRKAAYMFGWDWGPELADMGINKPIMLKGFSKARIKELYIRQEHSFGKVKLSCNVTEDYALPKGADLDNIQIRVSVISPEGELLGSTLTEDGKFDYVIENPRLWWCINYGEQPLYTVRAEVLDKGEVTDLMERQIGLRTLNICQKKDEWGEKFHFVINDVEVFAMGGDYIPEDSLLGRTTFEKSKKLIDDCIKANFNMIRIWGGGVYPTDEFLSYCDQTGIMIWQDFMFANIVCIWEGEEKANMAAEVRQLTQRMRNHPCIALLCGNNETELMVWEEMEKKYKEMYIQQFEVDMKAIVEKEAPDIFYWPSSPSSTGSMKDVEDMNVGDTHDWNVWHGQKPFTYFRSTFPRFNSEFGLQSFPCMKTLETFTEPQDLNIFSYVMEGHQKSKSGNEVINSYISQYFKFPKDFESFLYLSQTIQLEGIRYGVEHWRRNRNEQRCMGALYWQINDCWQVASWASIDCFGRWKALQYGAKRFYEPVLVSACEEGSRVELHISNETLVRVEGTLTWSLRHVDKGIIMEESVECLVERLHSSCCRQLDFSSQLQTEEDRRKYYLTYSFSTKEKMVGSGTVIFKPAKHFEFQKPEIQVVKLGEASYSLKSETFCKFVELRFEEDLVLSDNFFDLVPGEEKIITADRDVDEMPEVFTLYDSY